MKYFLVFLIFILLSINSTKLYAEDALTVKQQLDRIMEEIKDLNKAVFNKSFERKQLNSDIQNNDTERFTSVDIKIYDLEKDIKNLTLQFEEILFKLDDLSNEINFLKVDLITKFEKIQINSDNQNINKNNIYNNKELNVKQSEIKEENTLGKLIISDNTDVSNNSETKDFVEENKKQSNEKELNNLSPEELLQFALDQMMKKNYDKSKKILEDFVVSFPENQLSGSAHFWLGKIHLFESNYRKAAIIFGEGVQKFPESIKAPEMYYELAKSLKQMNKIPEACKTLSLLNDNYKGNKFTKDPDKIKDKMSCENQN
jgi:tol-pal system protein YbgF